MNAAPDRRIAFRLEFGGTSGWGHLARCAALAEEMSRRGWRCVLWSDGDVRAVPPDLRAPFHSAAPAGPTWMHDAPDVQDIVVDWYGASDDALRALRGSRPRATLLVIDDEATRQLDAADLIVNPRLGLRRSPYTSGARTLLGESYALLRAGLREPRTITAPWGPDTQAVLVMMGGTDPSGLTDGVLRGLAEIREGHLAPVVLAPPAVRAGLSTLLDRFLAHQWLECVDAPTLAGWARLCRCAVSACGGTLYELAALGLPFVGVIAADNQCAFAAAVAQHWRLPVVDGRTEGGEAAAVPLRKLWREPPPRAPFGGVDGLGVARVADALERSV